MAQRRMFSKTITSSARFLKMPADSQSLYFHLGINADDDGVVEAFSVMRTVGSNEDNLRVLAAKGLIKILNDDLVTFITDWQEHNLIRADRKVDSIYKPLLLKLVSESDLKQARPRADTGRITGRPVDDEWTAQYSVGKGSIGKDIESEPKEQRSRFKKPTVDEIKKYVGEKGFSVDAERFWAYYESKGWVVGKSPMKSWTAAVVSWESNERKKNTPVISTSDFMKMSPEQQAEARKNAQK